MQGPPAGRMTIVGADSSGRTGLCPLLDNEAEPFLGEVYREG